MKCQHCGQEQTTEEMQKNAEGVPCICFMCGKEIIKPKSRREKIAEMIAEQGDELWTLESYADGAVVMWYIKDHTSKDDPYGRLPQYQVWKENKRCYVGTNRNEAYADFERQKQEFMADYEEE